MRFLPAFLVGLMSMAAVASCGSPGLVTFGNGGSSSTSGMPSSGHGGASSAQSSGGTGGVCTSPKTCASQGFDCGVSSDGCGNTLDCGTCPAGQVCGAVSPGVCGAPCTPKSCSAQGFSCGVQTDGCGNTLDCGACLAGQVCGGGPNPMPGVCGCTPQSCSQEHFACGVQSDGCGNLMDCGACSTGLVCNAGTCTGSCTSKTCAQQGFNCGNATDTCGNALGCGTCPTGQTCGATTPNVCSCAPQTCGQQGLDCGNATDGCGTTLNCGTCPAGSTCGAVTPNVCGPTCMPKSCAQQGFNCGTATDTCGTTINCGTCPAGQSCGVKTPNVCASPTCTGLCLQQQTCPNGGTTSIGGKVFAPNGTDPLPGVTVYVPNGGPAPTYGVQPFAPGVSCQGCTASLSGSPLVSTTTGYDGSFVLTNMPVGTNIPIVLQKGRWRRQMVIPTVTACVNNLQPATGPGQLRLPQTKAEGDIPLMAFVTGSVDALECLLRKVGIADSEFSDPSGTGRVRFYLGSGAAGAMYSATTPSETTLWGSQAAINAYDMVYFACQGNDYEKTAAQQSIVETYANAGGRILATHYSYVWLYNQTDATTPGNSFSGTATWAVNGPNPAADPQTGYVNTAGPRGATLALWLQVVGASTTSGQVQIGTLRHDFTGVLGSSLLWLNINDVGTPPLMPGIGMAPMQYTFDTPVSAAPASQCGRVLYTDYHVEDATTTGTTFPAECVAGAMSAQEKMMEYMIFDLGACIGP